MHQDMVSASVVCMKCQHEWCCIFFRSILFLKGRSPNTSIEARRSIARTWLALGRNALLAKDFAKHLIATAAADVSMVSILEGVEDRKPSKPA